MSFVIRSVNWRDGMALRAADFRAERAAAEERVRWVTRHVLDDWGLVPWTPGVGAAPLEIDYRTGDGRLTVRVVRCLAVAPNGTLIHVDATRPPEEGGTPPLEAAHPLATPDGRARDLSVLIEPSASPGAEIEFGPLATSEPKRAAWAYPAFDLRIVDQLPAGASSMLEIARFRLDAGTAAFHEGFTPACLAVGSHPRMHAAAAELVEALDVAREHSLRVAGEEVAKRSGDAAAAVNPLLDLARQWTVLAASCHSEILDGGDWQAPRQLVVLGRRFVRGFRALVESYPEVLHESWKDYLATNVKIADHEAFRRAVDRAAGASLAAGSIGDALVQLVPLVKLISVFRPVAGPRPVGDLQYQGLWYNLRRARAVDYVVTGQGYHTLAVRGVEAIGGGSLLVTLRIREPRQRALASAVRVGWDPAFGSMPEVTVDSAFNRELVVVVLPDLKGGPPTFDTVYVTCPMTHLDLRQLETAPDVDVRVYHRA